MLVEHMQLLKQRDHPCQYWSSDGGLELDISINPITGGQKVSHQFNKQCSQ